MENIDLRFGYGLILAATTTVLGYIAYKRQRQSTEEQQQITYQKGTLMINETQNWKKELLAMMKKEEIINLFIHNQKQPTMTKELVAIDMAKICRLDLSNNHIQSLQQMCQIFLPSLQYLQIFNNHIHRISPLKKLNSPLISWIQSQNNPIRDYQALWEVNCPSIQWFWVEFFENDTETQSAKYMAKIETNKLNRLYIMNKDRIMEKRVNAALTRQFIGIEVRTRR